MLNEVSLGKQGEGVLEERDVQVIGNKSSMDPLKMSY